MTEWMRDDEPKGMEKRVGARDDHETRRVRASDRIRKMRVMDDEPRDRRIKKRNFHTLILDIEYVKKKLVSVTHAYVNGHNGHRKFVTR